MEETAGAGGEEEGGEAERGRAEERGGGAKEGGQKEGGRKEEGGGGEKEGGEEEGGGKEERGEEGVEIGEKKSAPQLASPGPRTPASGTGCIFKLIQKLKVCLVGLFILPQTHAPYQATDHPCNLTTDQQTANQTAQPNPNPNTKPNPIGCLTRLTGGQPNARTPANPWCECGVERSSAENQCGPGQPQQ